MDVEGRDEGPAVFLGVRFFLAGLMPARGNPLRLFFLTDHFHRLTTAYQYSFSSHHHFDFIPTDFAYIDLADLVGH
jgi:hypothetical protein